MSLLSIALAFFLITNPVGNTPGILAILAGIDTKRQTQILLRETLMATCLAVVFLLAGEGFLGALGIQGYTVSFCGGILLIIVSIGMIYPHHVEAQDVVASKKEPFLVPIAMPLLTGGGLLTTILLYAHQENNVPKVLMALVLSFSAVFVVMGFAPQLNRLLGKRGLIALEQLMGMVLLMLAIEMMVNGSRMFIETLQVVSP